MPVKYISYIPETTDGQAILDNFTRTRRVLRYRENNKVIDRIKRGLPLYEVETLEEVQGSKFKVQSQNAKDEGQRTKDNLLIRGECLSACAYLKDKNIKVDLIYIDPPFASGADYARKIYLRKNPKIAARLAEKEAEIAERLEAGEDIEIDEYKAFEEKMYGDIWHKEEYLNWMYENLTAIRSIMSETGSIYVHLDYHIGHYIKILLDEIFGEDFFKNELVWQRTSAHSSSTKFGNVHDVIFFYTKSEDYIWNEIYLPYNETYLEVFFEQTDENGKKYKRTDLTGAGVTSGDSGKAWRGINPSNK